MKMHKTYLNLEGTKVYSLNLKIEGTKIKKADDSLARESSAFFWYPLIKRMN